MEEIGSKWARFTWSNNRRGNMRIMEKLDRSLGNQQWSQKFPRAQCINEIAVGSDHSPLIIERDHSDMRGRKRFKFEQMWLEHDQCPRIIAATWTIGGAVRNINDLGAKLDRCKESLTEWSGKEFKHNVTEINKVKRQLSIWAKRRISPEEEDQERAIKSRLNALWIREELFWKQRSRLKWLAHGDRNTSYFHRTTLARRQRNKLV